MLEAGTVPWQKPWNVRTGPPRNFVSKRPYRGINVFLLLSAAYESPFWLTFRQANQLGGHIRKGERGSPIVFCKQIEVDGKDAGEPGQLRLLRFYHVFNVAQCENLGNIPPLSEQLGTLMKPAQIVANMPRPPHLRPGMARAFYSPGEDAVGMPTPSRFTSEEEYYSALFHELIHSTGHESRLNRPTLTEQVGFGSDPYCKEELIAEMGAAFLCAHAGIIERTLDNSSAYIDGWLERLRRDRRLLVHAAAQAQSAADFILGVKSEDPAAETPNVGQP
jgi:antirestriction protein ArdC